jgi:hypothetical protein
VLDAVRDGGRAQGLFSWPLDGAEVTLSDVDIEGCPGPAVDLRGPSRYVFEGVHVTDSGTLSFVPGALVAVEGVEPWDDEAGTGLLITDSSFVGLPVAGIFFDASGGTLGGGNTFSGLGEVDVWMQSCEDAPEVVFLGEEPSTNGCEGAEFDLAPLLLYEIELLDMFSVQE